MDLAFRAYEPGEASSNFPDGFLRYGPNMWGDWHKVGSHGIDGEEGILELGENEEICAIAGHSFDRTGLTFSLQAETSTGRSWGPFGDFKLDFGRSLRSSGSPKKRLTHISGDDTFDNYILRWLPQFT